MEDETFGWRGKARTPIPLPTVLGGSAPLSLQDHGQTTHSTYNVMVFIVELRYLMRSYKGEGGYCIGGKFGGFPQKLLEVFKFGGFVQKYLVLAPFAIVSGTDKCLVALAGPFSVAYFPIFAPSLIGV